MMERKTAIGWQSFEAMRNLNIFYVDKTGLIKEWWDNRDAVTLITRPRRFGKTLNLDMLNCFFSNKYANRSDLFEGLSIWEFVILMYYRNTLDIIKIFIYYSYNDLSEI